MESVSSKKILGIALLVISVLLLAYVLSFRMSAPLPCTEEAFGANLGFETGSLNGWSAPLGGVEIVTDAVHSGRYSAFVNVSSKHSSEVYQNWRVNRACEIYLEAYLLVTCPSEAGSSWAGIQLREKDSVELHAWVCPVFPTGMRGEDSILTRVRIANKYNDWLTEFPFDYSRWYKFGLGVLEGRIGFYVNDRLLHVENRTVELSYPSFGGSVGVYSRAHLDDFAMGQKNPSNFSMGPSIVGPFGPLIASISAFFVPTITRHTLPHLR